MDISLLFYQEGKGFIDNIHKFYLNSLKIFQLSLEHLKLQFKALKYLQLSIKYKNHHISNEHLFPIYTGGGAIGFMWPHTRIWAHTNGAYSNDQTPHIKRLSR